MINHTKETLLTLAEAARTLPSRHAGKNLNPSTLFRWASKGVGAGGGVGGVGGVKLSTIKIGATTFTSREALQQFFNELTAADQTQADPPAPETAIEAELDRLGLT